MANHKSAEKRARQAERRRIRNRQVKGRVKAAVKTCRDRLASGDAASAGEALRVAERELRRAASQGVIPARRASRTVSRLAHRLPARSPSA